MMNSVSGALNKNEARFVGALIAALAFSVFFLSGQETVTNDVYWHIKMGESLVRDGIFPVKDTFSFTYYGKEVVAFPYIFQSILYVLDQWVGYDNLSHLYLFSIYVLFVAASKVYLDRLKATLSIQAAALVALTMLYCGRLLVRPDILNALLIVIALIQYESSLRDFSLKNILLNTALVVFWTNYHTAIYAYVLFFGLYADLAVKFYFDKAGVNQWRGWFYSGLLLVVAGFLNPFFMHPVVAQFQVDPSWQGEISEYQNLFFTWFHTLMITPITVLAFLAILFAVKKRMLGKLIVVVIFVAATINYSRVLAHGGMVLTLLLASLLVMQARSEHNFVTLTKQITPYLLMICFGALLVMNLYSKAGRPVYSNKPFTLVNYFKQQGYKGNIINDYGVGGFLIYHLAPESKVMIDGRAGILYDIDLNHYQKQVLWRNEKELKEFSINNDAKFMLVRNDFDLFQIAYTSDLFSLDYVDKYFSLFVRGKGNFHLSGFFSSSPYCWDSGFLENIEVELSVANNLGGVDRKFVDFLNMVVLFEKQSDKEQFLRSHNFYAENVYIKRFFAYEALRYGFWGLSHSLFTRLEDFQSKDYIAASHAAYMMNEYQVAAELLGKGFRYHLKNVEHLDRVLMLGLFRKIEQKFPDMSEEHKGFKKQIENYLISEQKLPEKIEINYGEFCKDGVSKSSIFLEDAHFAAGPQPKSIY